MILATVWITNYPSLIISSAGVKKCNKSKNFCTDTTDSGYIFCKKNNFNHNSHLASHISSSDGTGDIILFFW